MSLMAQCERRYTLLSRLLEKNSLARRWRRPETPLGSGHGVVFVQVRSQQPRGCVKGGARATVPLPEAAFPLLAKRDHFRSLALGGYQNST